MAAPAEAAGRPSKRSAVDQYSPPYKIPRTSGQKKAWPTIQNCVIQDPTKLPRYNQVAAMTKADADPGPITPEKLIEVVFKASTHAETPAKAIRVQRHQRERLPRQGQALEQEGGDQRGRPGGLGPPFGAPRFAALAMMVKEDSLDVANVLQRLHTGFLRCRLEVDHKNRTLGGDKKRVVHQCIVSCNADVIGHETAGSKKEAKEASYQAIWNWLLSYPESP